jgi:arsenate reductase
MVRVLFACVHNAGRSQMAAAFFNALADPALARAESAGTRPSNAVNPLVTQVMEEVGIDFTAAKPRLLTPQIAADAQWLITMGCGEECPVVPGARRDDWPVEDPASRPLAEIRQIRDEIGRRVLHLVAANGWQRE